MATNFPNSPSNNDTHTVDGIIYIYDSTNAYWQKQTSTAASEITGHILPDTDVTYDIGSASKKFKDLYLDGNTLYLGTKQIKSTATGIELPELTIGSGTNKVKLVATTTGKLETTGTNSSGTTASAKASLDADSNIEDLSNVDLTIAPEVLEIQVADPTAGHGTAWLWTCLLYTSPSPRDVEESRMPSSA